MTPPLLYPRLEPPWLIAELGTSLRVLSFAPYRSGFVMAARNV